MPNWVRFCPSFLTIRGYIWIHINKTSLLLWRQIVMIYTIVLLNSPLLFNYKRLLNTLDVLNYNSWHVCTWSNLWKRWNGVFFHGILYKLVCLRYKVGWFCVRANDLCMEVTANGDGEVHLQWGLNIFAHRGYDPHLWDNWLGHSIVTSLSMFEVRSGSKI